MLIPIKVPKDELNAILHYLHWGRPTEGYEHIVEKTYHGQARGVEVTAALKDSVQYEIESGGEAHTRMVKAPICFFPEFGVTVFFDEI